MSVAGLENSCDELARRTIEDEHRMVHVGVVKAVEEGELLGAVGRIAGCVDVEHDNPRILSQSVDIGLLEPVKHGADVAHLHRVLQPRQRWLRGQC